MKKSEKTPQKPRTHFVVMGSIGIAIVLLTVALLVPKKIAQRNLKYSRTPLPIAYPSSPSPWATPKQQEYIRVIDQGPGTEFRIDEVITDKLGFILLRVNEERIGVSDFLIGDSRGVTIRTESSLQLGQEVTVIFYEDDGDREFSEKDSPALNSMGETIESTFIITQAGMILPYEGRL